ncbi:MAG: serine aminopeptidase domain-containing protein [Syntrophales bacterium]
MDVTRVFIHGLESSSRGNKGVYFRTRYPDMIIEDFEGPLADRMTKLNTILSHRRNLILVGSSFGGLMAAMYALRHEEETVKLILLAPALDLPDFIPFREKQTDIPTIIFHGKKDDVVPLSEVREIAKKIFRNLSYHVVEDDHPLRDTFETYDWPVLLSPPG